MGFHTTALCTAGALSLGSRGRCFFKAGVVGVAEDDEGVAVALDTAVRFMVVGEGVVKETMLTGMATEDCVEVLEDEEAAALFSDRSVDGVRALPASESADQ